MLLPSLPTTWLMRRATPVSSTSTPRRRNTWTSVVLPTSLVSRTTPISPRSQALFSLAAPEFEHDGILILEILFMPMALHIKRNMFHYRKGVLEHVLVCFHVGEFRQFAFAQSLTFLLFTFTQSQPLSSRACPQSHRTGCHEGCRRASWTVDLACRRMSSACLCRGRRYMR